MYATPPTPNLVVQQGCGMTIYFWPSLLEVKSNSICTSSPGPYSHFLKFYQISRSISVSIYIYLYHSGQKLMALNTCPSIIPLTLQNYLDEILFSFWENDIFCSPWFEVLPFTLFHFSSLVSNCSQWWNLNHFSWKVYVFHVCSSLFISPAATLVLMVNNLYLLQESSYLLSWSCPPSSKLARVAEAF